MADPIDKLCGCIREFINSNSSPVYSSPMVTDPQDANFRAWVAAGNPNDIYAYNQRFLPQPSPLTLPQAAPEPEDAFTTYMNGFNAWVAAGNPPDHLAYLNSLPPLETYWDAINSNFCGTTQPSLNWEYMPQPPPPGP